MHTTWTLLFTPTGHVFEAPLANFFTKQRLSQVLRAITSPPDNRNAAYSQQLEEDCMTQFVFCVIHAKACEESWPFPAEPDESLAIVTSKSFPVETAMHPSWTGYAPAPDEFDNNVVDYNDWPAHRWKCVVENRQWYNQACVEKLNRTTGAMSFTTTGTQKTMSGLRSKQQHYQI